MKAGRDQTGASDGPSLGAVADELYGWFLRFVALFLIFFTLQYWMRLTGFNDGANWRFDTMPEHWRFAAAVLAVAMPVAALGLWGRLSWGIAIWLPVISMELAMYGILDELYGSSPFRLAFHGICLALLAVFQGTLWYSARRVRRERGAPRRF